MFEYDVFFLIDFFVVYVMFCFLNLCLLDIGRWNKSLLFCGVIFVDVFYCCYCLLKLRGKKMFFF